MARRRIPTHISTNARPGNPTGTRPSRTDPTEAASLDAEEDGPSGPGEGPKPRPFSRRKIKAKKFPTFSV